MQKDNLTLVAHSYSYDAVQCVSKICCNKTLAFTY